MNRKKIVLLIVCVVMIAAGFISIRVMVNNMNTNSPEKQWSEDGTPFGHVAAYFADTEGVTIDGINQYRSELNSYIKEDSIEVNENARAFIDSYSAYGACEIKTGNGKNAVKVNVCAFGGDYFAFHTEPLIYGNYFAESDLMDDKIVIDENAAWFLYGSTDVCGKYAKIGGEVFLIVGVVKGEGPEKKNSTYGSRPRIYMSYSAYQRINPEEKITCFEVIYPDLVTNYAYKKMYKALTGEEPQLSGGLFGLGAGSGDDDDASGTESVYDNKESGAVEIINVTTRFKISKLWGVLKSYGVRSSQTTGIIYPYWENAGRRCEDYCAAALLWIIIWSAVLLVNVIWLAVIYRDRIRIIKQMTVKQVKRIGSIKRIIRIKGIKREKRIK